MVQPATAAPKAPEGNITVCNEETLSTLREDGTPLTEKEIKLAVQAIRGYCDSENGVAASGEGVVPFGIGYGKYIRNSTQSTTVNCSCGSYRSWTIDVNAVGVPYTSPKVNNLNVIWRVTPGSSAWQYGPSLPITSYGTLPTVSGTMTTYQYITSIATVANNAGQVLENVQAVAP